MTVSGRTRATQPSQPPNHTIRRPERHRSPVLRLRDGSQAEFRPIRPEDEPLMVRFHEGLSETSVYHRYFCMLKLEERTSHARLARICFNDYAHEIAYVLDRLIPGTGQHEIIGVARLSRLEAPQQAEYAIILTDRWQHQGLGTQTTRRMIEIARRQGIQRVRVVVLGDNRDMLRLAEKHRFRVVHSGDGEVVAELSLE